MLTGNTATHIGTEWINAWYSHDLDRIMEHYAVDIHFTSPFIVRINDDLTGVINSQAALREYFDRALKVYPDLHFELFRILVSVNSIVIYYKSVNNLFAAEVMEINEAGKIIRVIAHYAQ